MRTTIVFFESVKESRNGTMRGLVAFIYLAIVNVLWYYLVINFQLYDEIRPPGARGWIFILTFFLLCSALGAQKPGNAKEAIVYGLLLGFVIWGVQDTINYSLYQSLSIWDAFVDWIYGTLSMGLVAGMLFYTFKNSRFI